MRLAILAAAAALALSGQAYAGPPKIDGTKYCASLSGLLGDSKIINDGCLENEAKSAKNLARIWDSVPAEDRDSCVKLMAFSQPSNQGLAGCLALTLANHCMDGDFVCLPRGVKQ